MIVPNSMCTTKPQPEPQFCNINDCPLRGRFPSGASARNLVETTARSVNGPEQQTSGQEACNGKAYTLEYPNPPIAGTNSIFIQHDPEKNKITLKFGGAATVFFGKQVKIKCPFKRFNRIKILWAKVADARCGITRTWRTQGSDTHAVF
uniref:(northern house mosquito) hypothetical protein n=2 Tax=Culex pipiens TaxID=7175 RepID=A0A8D8I9E0_CULPI